MVFTSIHPSLKPLLFSTQGPNLLNPWLNPLHQFQLPVHPSSFNHLSRIWVFISILECPSIGRFPKHARHLTSTFVHCATFDLPSPLRRCKTIAAAIVGSRLDYCNSVTLFLLAHLFQTWLAYSLFKIHLPGSLLKNLVFATFTPVLSELHWLPVRHRINFKIATIAFKVLQFQQPSYPAALIPRYVPTRSLRSSSSLSLCVPTRKTEMAKSKSFSSVASSVWNRLPGHLTSISTLPAFRKRLKHHLCLSAFPGNPSPSTGITFCGVSPSTDATQVRHTPPPG